MQFKVAICDDEKNEIKHIYSLIKRYSMDYNITFSIDTFNSSREFLSAYNIAGQYDIVFLDVEMPGISGIDLAHKIRHIPDTWVKIVFVSNYPEYMQDSFNVQAFNYLEKPLTYETFSTLISRIAEQIQSGRDDILILEDGNFSETVPIKDILYIETVNSKSGMLHCITIDKEIECKGSISDMEEKLAPHSFVSPHRGILVNLLHVHYINSTEVTLDNGKTLPLSRRQEKYIKSIFAKGIITLYH
ncbi:MAG: LytR/AlgR family response regulator transcription factor [Coprococcus sp.]